MDEFIHEPRIAYFSMEIALRSEIKTYTGGLGVLAGDTMRSAADLRLPLVAVSLVSRAGHFRQIIDPAQGQLEQPDPWEPRDWMRPLEAKIAVSIEGRTVWIGAWLYVLESQIGGPAPVVMLDTALDENESEDRAITQYLYGGDARYRLKQEIVLGVGGLRMLQALGFRIRQYHMNEGHSAMLGLELLRRHAYRPEDVRPGESAYDLPRVRSLCSFTTHTPVEAGHDRFPYPMVKQVFGEPVDLAVVKALAGEGDLNMTRLALNLSEFVNGVAKRHAEVSTTMFPGYHVQAITNGVHPHTWTAPSFRKLYDGHLPGWCHEPELLVRAEYCISDREVWDAHLECKHEMLARVRSLAGAVLDPALPTIGFARRMTSYKRPDLLFADLQRLAAIAVRRPFQVVIAGKAHPRDEQGKALIRRLLAHARDLAGRVPVVYLPDYDLELARTLIAGVDVWLNTPLPPLEASGTSGMKAAFNGVPSLSVLDGWWVEGCIEGLTGWAVEGADAGAGGDASTLYDKLDSVVLPLYCASAPEPWCKVMKGAISRNAPYFNSHRMMRRYATEAYIR